jgi:hypothetical protein
LPQNQNLTGTQKPLRINQFGETAMNSTILEKSTSQTGREETNDARLKWAKPHLNTLGVADGTNLGKSYSTTEGVAKSGTPMGAVS